MIYLISEPIGFHREFMIIQLKLMVLKKWVPISKWLAHVNPVIDLVTVSRGQGTFEYRGDDEDARLVYDGEWKDKAAQGYGVMKWQNGDR